MNPAPTAGRQSAAKQFAAGAVRAASHLAPATILFDAGLLMRRLRHNLERSGKRESLCRMLDFAILSFRPAKAKRLVKWDGRQATLRLRVNDPMHYDLALGIHEPIVRDFLASNLKPGMTVFDIGANVGFFTVLSAQLVGPQGKVVAIEGDPAVAAMLQENASLNGFSNITVVAGVAARTDGIMRFGRGKASGWSGLHSESAEEWIEVPAHTVDSLVAQLRLDRMDIVKVDVEGAEAEVVAGMTQSLRTFSPVILVELHPGAESPLPALAAAGYQVRSIEAGAHSEGEPAHYVAERSAVDSSGPPSANPQKGQD
jgi:FkbM family methyltransferase